ncbi:MAG: hypothetical protein EAZ07_02855 [Cytophagales bacterium]|nr:MAG: hypothetical protein EAZ07_02855 [Cytophagales bacterium]
MKTIFTFTQAFIIMMSITFAAKAETAKEILRRKIKTEALSFFNSKQYDKALDLYLQINDESVEKGQIDYMIGMCYMSSNEKHKALPYLISASNSNQNTFVVNYYLGKAFYNAGDYGNAALHLEKYIKDLATCKGLVFKKVKNINDQHKVHYEKTDKDVQKVIDACKTKLAENKSNQEPSKANASESTTENEAEIIAIPASR